MRYNNTTCHGLMHAMWENVSMEHSAHVLAAPQLSFPPLTDFTERISPSGIMPLKASTGTPLGSSNSRMVGLQYIEDQTRGKGKGPGAGF